VTAVLDVPGVALVAHGDDVHVETAGLERETIFRIASITKPITAAAAMLLVEEGTISLDDPIATWLPELASPSVLRDPAGPVDDVVPAERPVTVFDLLTFRAGWGFPSDFSLPAVALLFETVHLHGRPPEDLPAPDEFVAAVARNPLMFQPGEAWLYNLPSDILGVLVERSSGTPFAQFLAERIFVPLGMVDTAFSVPRAELDRLAPYPGEAKEQWVQEPRFASGAGGLVSTADDWLAFGRMLLAGGAPILTEASVRLMTTDHLTQAQRDASTLFLEGEGWGFGGAVGANGRYGWVGGSGTSAHVLPSTQTVAILLTQVPMTGPTPTPLMRAFWESAGVAPR
jgi:CubicO group peptidase (beta-lactamase class C family)